MMITLTSQDMLILLFALDAYMNDLHEREKHSDYWFRSYALENRKQIAEENRILLHARMLHVDQLKSRFLLTLSNSWLE